MSLPLQNNIPLEFGYHLYIDILICLVGTALLFLLCNGVDIWSSNMFQIFIIHLS